MPKSGYQQSWQYVPENSTEVPSSASSRFRLPGLITGDTPLEARFNTKAMRGLKTPSDTDMRRVDAVVASKNEYPWSVSYTPVKTISAPKYDFRHFMGFAMNASSATTDAGAWTYGTTITTALRYFTIFKEIDNLQTRFSGCLIDRFTAKASVDTPVEFSAEGHASLATNADFSRTDATSLKDGTPFMWSDVTVYLDGTRATNVTAFEFNISNNAGPNHVLGDRDPEAIRLGGRDIEVALTFQYNDLGQYVTAKNSSTASRITIRLDQATDADIVFRECKFDAYPIPSSVDPKDILVHTFRFKAEEMSVN